MIIRVLVVFLVVGCLLSPCLADTILFKNGKKKTVRIYKVTREYVSYLEKDKIRVVARDKIKDKGITFDSKPLTEKELAEALKRAREALKKDLKREEKKNKIKPTKSGGAGSATGDKKPRKGVKVIAKEKSDTNEIELKIDPFPDHPVTDKKPKKK